MKASKIKILFAAAMLAFNVLVFLPAMYGQAITCDAGTTPTSSGLCLKQQTGTGLLGATSITDLIIKIIDILLGIAFIVAVLFLIIGGYRYIFSNGNEEQAAAGQHTITNALIGVVVIILSYVIVAVVSNTISR